MKVDIVAFDKIRARNAFDCGRGAIDRWYKNSAKKCSERLEVRVFEALETDSQHVVGFYALRLGSERIASLRIPPTDYVQNHAFFPSVHLAYLGVHSEFQRRGVGKALLSDVFDRVVKISEHAGFYALTLESLDATSTSFYESLGFETYAGTKASPKMLISLRTICELVLDSPH